VSAHSISVYDCRGDWFLLIDSLLSGEPAHSSRRIALDPAGIALGTIAGGDRAHDAPAMLEVLREDYVRPRAPRVCRAGA